MKEKKTPQSQKGLSNFSFSRRGLFALFATVAGMGLSDLTPQTAEALAGIGLDHPNQPRYFGNATDTGDLTHPDRTTGSNDRLFGYANQWTLWNIYNTYRDRLGYAFAMAVECDYSNELYDHIVFRPFFYFTSYCASNKWHGYWLGSYDGDDNRGSVYIDSDTPIGSFQGNFINNGTDGHPELSHLNSAGWLWRGWDAGSIYETFIRREGAKRGRNVWAKCEVFNVWHNNTPPSPDVWSTQYAPIKGDLSLHTQAIQIRNDVTLYGGIFKLAPLAMPDARVDLTQGGYGADGRAFTQWGNGRGLCFWSDYEGINQMWAFKPYLNDGVGTFTFALASLAGPNLVHTLNNCGHINVGSSWKNGNMEAGSAIVHDISAASDRENSWWIDHEPSVSNETDHTCYFITSDSDGQRLDTAGATGDGGAVRINSYSCPGVWRDQPNAQFKLIEARCGGYVKNSKKTAKIGDSVTCIGFMPDSDETATLTPNAWLHSVSNRKELPPQPMYRWYVTREMLDIPDDDAVIMAHCSVSTWGKQTEAPAHRHIGYPHGGQSVYGLALHVVGSQFGGSICYAARACGSSTWETGRDGAEVCGSPIAEVKIWLTGELAENYDLCYRSIPIDGRWTDTVYSSGHADNDGTAAPACGSHGSAQMCGLNVHLIRKPRGGRVVKEFSFDDTIEIKEDISKGDDAVWLWSAAMMGITTVPADEKRFWTDRMLGTVVVGTGLPHDTGEIPENPPTRLQSTVHFMLVDTLGDTQEVHTVYIRLNSEYRASERQSDFSDARAAIEQAMRGEGQDMSLLDSCLDGWYEGDDKCSDPGIFKGGKFVSRRVNGDLYLWTRVRMGKFIFFKDGLAKDNIIFTSPRYLTGTDYTFPQEVIDRQLEPTCNLNDKFGTDPSTGFTGWHLDKALGDEAITHAVASKGITPLYGRNRCTLRTEYAPGSVELDPSWDMRLLPEEGAEPHPGFIPTFDEPSHKGYDAKGGEFDLAAIGDSGEGHTAYYWDELARITVPATAYRNLGGGQWRTYKCEAWLDADEANAVSEASETGVSGRSRSRARAASAVKMIADTVRYIRWTEVVSDGVVGVRRK